MPADKPQLLTAKVDRLAAIIADGNQRKNSNTVSNARQAMEDAAREVGAATTVAGVENVALPSERE